MATLTKLVRGLLVCSLFVLAFAVSMVGLAVYEDLLARRALADEQRGMRAQLEALSVQVDAIAEPFLTGQIVESHGIATERWLGESLEDWARRHTDAVRAFHGDDE